MAENENTLQRTGEAFGEAPPGHGTEAFTDEALFGEQASQEEAQPLPVTAGTDDVENIDTVGDAAYQGTEDPKPETPAQEAARKLAGRYNSVEDLEAGYKNIQRLQSRTSEQLRAEAARRAELEAAFQQIAPLLQQQQQDVNPADIYDPAVLQRIIDQRVAQGTQQATQAFQQQQVAQAISGAVDSFRAAHPEVAPGTPVDETIAQVVLEFQTDPEGNLNHDLFPVTVENLEVAYELTRNERLGDMVRELDLIPNPENLDIAREALSNPALADVLMAEPELLDSDAGLAHARRLANLPGFYEAATTAVQPPNGEQMRRSAYVETGGTGAPVSGAPGQRPLDEMDEAIRVFNSGRDSVFTGWKPS